MALPGEHGVPESCRPQVEALLLSLVQALLLLGRRLESSRWAQSMLYGCLDVFRGMVNPGGVRLSMQLIEMHLVL